MPAINEDALNFLDARRSTPSRLLGEPGPDDDQLERMLTSVVRVPDHGRLVPWRFIRVQGEARAALGQTLLAIFQREHPDAREAQLDKERGRFASAPLILIVVGRISAGHKIPEVEQRLSGGAVCFQLLLVAHALGFGAQWLSGWAAYHPDIHTALGLAEGEEILGFIHIGTPAGELPEHVRPEVASLLQDWTP